MLHILQVFVVILFLSCNQEKTGQKHYEWKTLKVTATAYNSLSYQTNNNPNITAFGDSLVPGKKYIAVSRDLLELGLTHNTFVTIEGFKGIYLVKDKMNRRWKNRIDIYMGTDVKAAKTFGRQQLSIHYRVPVSVSEY